MLTIIGCGNSNRSDDGVGPYIAQQLAAHLKTSPADEVRIFDAGTGGMDVMFKARGSSELIIIDACSSDSEPGSVFEVPEAELRIRQDPVTNMHDFRWQHALYTGRQIFGDDFPINVTVLLIETQSTGLGLTLSAKVKVSADALIATLKSRYVSPLSRPKTRSQLSFEMALQMAEESSASDTEKAAMLAEIAQGLQQHATSIEDHRYGIALLRRALGFSQLDGNDMARLQVQLATGLSQIPSDSSEPLHEARLLLDNAMNELAIEEERASAAMQQGLIVQSLASMGAMDHAVAAGHYQAALRFFRSSTHPAEYAIIHNNLATLWLSMPRESAQHRLYEAMAVQAFETALANINAQSHPDEYAMLQNNLGNALQHSDSGDLIANKMRAIEAYDIALSLRKQQPHLQANTLANRANCLRDIPDNLDKPELGNRHRLAAALNNAQQAQKLFEQGSERDKANMMAELIADLHTEMNASAAHAG